jgi:hypothetical protein
MIDPSEPKVVMSMEAVRCTRCGETRWSLFSRAAEEAQGQPCEMCGGPTVPERRRPGAGPPILPAERRSRFVHAGGGRQRSAPPHAAVR